MSYGPNTRRQVTSSISVFTLATGFIALAIAFFVAAGSPADHYELSIYAGTPILYWITLGWAVLAATVGLVTTIGRYRALAVVLAGGSLFALVALPLLRGYYFYGTADPLTHLGWARRLAAGAIGPTELIYPGLHTFAVFFAQLSTWPVRHSLLLANATFAVAFVAFVGLTMRVIVPRSGALAIGTVAALLLLPINHIATHLRTHPFSQTTLYVALVVFVLALYVTRARDDRLSTTLTREGALLSLVAVASILFHPQVAADLLVVFMILVGLQLIGRAGYLSSSGAGTLPSLLGPTAVFAVAYAVWALQGRWFLRATTTLAESLLLLATGQPLPVGDRLASQSASLLAIGSGPLEVVLKLFVPTTVFLLLAGGFVLALLTGRVSTDGAERVLAGPVLVIGAVVASGFVAVYFVSSIAEMYFRHLGFLMLFVTFLGANGLVYALGPITPAPAGARRGADRRPLDHAFDGGTRVGPGRVGQLAVVVGIVVLLALSGAVAYQSPYIYKANQHVTDREAAAYEWAIDTGSPELTIAGIRTNSPRFQDAVLGPGVDSHETVSINGSELTTLEAAIPGGGLFVVSERDYQREIQAYRSLRYEDGQFESIAGQVGVGRVYANGDTTVYLVRGGAGAGSADLGRPDRSMAMDG